MDDASSSNNNNINNNKNTEDKTLDKSQIINALSNIDTSEIIANFRKSGAPEMSEAIPFLARPKVLNKELAGDFGFDPLNLAKDRTTLWYYREIEVKHARLAMLVSHSLGADFLDGIRYYAGWLYHSTLSLPSSPHFSFHRNYFEF